MLIKSSGKVKQSLYWPWGFQAVEAPKFHDNRHMKIVRFSALQTGRFYPPRKYSWYSFLLEAESISRLYCGRKDYVKEKFQPATF